MPIIRCTRCTALFVNPSREAAQSTDRRCPECYWATLGDLARASPDVSHRLSAIESAARAFVQAMDALGFGADEPIPGCAVVDAINQQLPPLREALSQ